MVDEIQGLKELNRALKLLPDRVAKNVLKSAIRAGGREVVKQSRLELKRSRFNYQTLSKSIATKVLRQRGYSLTALVGPRVGYTGRGKRRRRVANDGWYATIVEYGTLGSRTKPLAPGTKRKRAYDPMPEGLKPSPFMRPGFEHSKGRAMRAIQDKLWKGIEKEAARLR